MKKRPDNPRLVSEVLGYDDGRRVSAFVPSMAAEAVVYAADGGWHVERLGRALEDAGIGSTMVVGVHGLDDDDDRLAEYVPGFDDRRFVAHERFFVDQVQGWVAERLGVALPVERTAVWGRPSVPNSRWPWGSAIPTSMGPSSLLRPVLAIDRRRCFPTSFPASIWSQELRSRSSSTMPSGGQPLFRRRVPPRSSPSGPEATVTDSGSRSSPRWSPGRSQPDRLDERRRLVNGMAVTAGGWRGAVAIVVWSRLRPCLPSSPIERPLSPVVRSPLVPFRQQLRHRWRQPSNGCRRLWRSPTSQHRRPTRG